MFVFTTSWLSTTSSNMDTEFKKIENDDNELLQEQSHSHTDNCNHNPKPGDVFLHYKGGEYIVTGYATWSGETK